jgi:RNA polymerase sigma-70 factor (ECF subfamily)
MTDADVFLEHRPALFGLAYRMLGSAADADDVVSDAYIRWHKVDQSDVEDPRGYLMTVVTRLALDELKSARRRRETYVGTWLPEPIPTVADDAGDPAAHVERRDTLSLAFLTLLEKLSPPERAVFVLREAFDYPHAEIANVLEVSEANSRQLHRRAVQRLGDTKPRFVPSLERQRELLETFSRAAFGGDPALLHALLTEDCVIYGDGGGKASALRQPLQGRERAAKFIEGLVRLAPPDLHADEVEINGELAYVMRTASELVGVYAFQWTDDGHLAAVHAVRNPDKLTTLIRPPVAL